MLSVTGSQFGTPQRFGAIKFNKTPTERNHRYHVVQQNFRRYLHSETLPFDRLTRGQNVLLSVISHPEKRIGVSSQPAFSIELKGKRQQAKGPATEADWFLTDKDPELVMGGKDERLFVFTPWDFQLLPKCALGRGIRAIVGHSELDSWVGELLTDASQKLKRGKYIPVSLPAEPSQSA